MITKEKTYEVYDVEDIEDVVSDWIERPVKISEIDVVVKDRLYYNILDEQEGPEFERILCVYVGDEGTYLNCSDDPYLPEEFLFDFDTSLFNSYQRSYEYYEE